MATRYININYPFKDSNTGFFLDLNSDDQNAIKADLLHLILTRKGQRLYNPDFGTDLLRYIFEPNDSLTLSKISEEITTVVKKYLLNLGLSPQGNRDVPSLPPTESRQCLAATSTFFSVSPCGAFFPTPGWTTLSCRRS